MAMRIFKSDSEILKELKMNQNKLTDLDVNYLFGRIKDEDYGIKRNMLKKEVENIIEREKLRAREKI
jgi:hypothetical protein